jgi:hypothetical protein
MTRYDPEGKKETLRCPSPPPPAWLSEEKTWTAVRDHGKKGLSPSSRVPYAGVTLP